MASRFVVCKDKEEAQKMYEVGLLYLSFDTMGEPSYVHAGAGFSGRWALDYYGGTGWPPKDFAYLVEEDDSPTTEDDACG